MGYTMVLRRKFTILNTSRKERKKDKINTSSLHKELEKEQIKPKVGIWKEMIKIRAEINKMML